MYSSYVKDLYIVVFYNYFVNIFSVQGKIISQTITSFDALKIQVMDDDQQWFEDRNDDLLGSGWVNNDGSFEISFDDSSFKDSWVEMEPRIYLIIRNKDGQIIHRTTQYKIQIEDKRETTIKIPITVTIDSLKKKPELITDVDPYANNNNRILSAFSSLNDVYTINNSDFVRNFTLLNNSINAWLVYAQEFSWKRIGYDGPQVPRYPRKQPDHKHTLSWEKMA